MDLQDSFHDARIFKSCWRFKTAATWALPGQTCDDGRGHRRRHPLGAELVAQSAVRPDEHRLPLGDAAHGMSPAYGQVSIVLLENSHTFTAVYSLTYLLTHSIT